MQGEYTTPKSQKEIYSLFQRESDKGAFVWVEHPHTKVKEVFPISDLKLDKNEKKIDLKLERDFALEGHSFVYIYHPFRKTISKTKLIATHQDVMLVNIPKIIKTMCYRGKSRFKFRPKDEKYVLVQVQSPLMKSATQELLLQLIDISQSGMAVSVSHANREFLKNSDFLKLTQLGKIALPEPIDIEVVYVRPFNYLLGGKRVQSNRVGIKFSEEIKKFVIEGFSKF